jgi:hypothetical protein
MAEAMGFELMDLLQSTVFKSMIKISNFNELWQKVFRFDCVQLSLGTAANGQKRTLPMSSSLPNIFSLAPLVLHLGH